MSIISRHKKGMAVSAVVSVSMSQDFVENVRQLYFIALDQMVTDRVARHGINCYTHHAPPAYASAVAAIEAYLNEVAFSPMTRAILRDSQFWTLDQEWLERLELRSKLLLIPVVLFGKGFERDAQPYQDLALLVKVRNDLVHYKMKSKIPSYVADLEQREIALKSGVPDADYVWAHKISSSEGIRWAYNTMCRVAKALVALAPDAVRDTQELVIQSLAEIDETIANERLAAARLKTPKPA